MEWSPPIDPIALPDGTFLQRPGRSSGCGTSAYSCQPHLALRGNARWPAMQPSSVARKRRLAGTRSGAPRLAMQYPTGRGTKDVSCGTTGPRQARCSSATDSALVTLLPALGKRRKRSLSLTPRS